MLRAIQSSAPLTLHAPVRAAIIVLATAGSQGLAQDCMWVPLNATGPASQYYPPVAAWDSTRQRMVVVESRQNDLILRTWEWDGTSWTRETTPASSNPFVTGAAAGGPNAVWAVGYRFELNAYANRTLTLLGS